jgi:hypothetical protein
VVHRALEAERPSAVFPGHDLGHERVARRAADSLADPVDDTDREDVAGSRGERHERPYGRGERVAGDDEGLAPAETVGEAARDDLEDGRDRLRDTLDDTQERGARPQGAGQERRQQRVDHLAARVGEEADEAERADRAV